MLCSLLSLTKPVDLAVGDQADGESEEYVVDVVATFPADPKAVEAVAPGDRTLEDVAEDDQAGDLMTFGTADRPAHVPRDSGRIRGNLRRPHRYHSGLLS